MKKPVAITMQDKEEYINAEVTLNGKRAKVNGRMLDFPFVTTLDGAISVEYSWYAVKNVIENKGGKFKA